MFGMHSAHTRRQTLWLAMCLQCALACGDDDDPTPPVGGTGGASGNQGVSGNLGVGGNGSGVSGAGGRAGSSGAPAGSGGVGPSAGVGGRSGSGGVAGAANSGDLVNPAPGSKFFLGANFWNIEWEGGGNYFMNGVEWSSTQNPWNPQLISDLAPYHVLRFMDWNLTNVNDNPQADWSTRAKPTDDQEAPVAFEWQIDLCNRAKKDYWVNIPHEADEDYAAELASLIHDKLDPSLRVYVEWSNEVWNPGFPQRRFAEQQADQRGLGGAQKWATYQAYASVRVFEAFESVFGKNSPRLVKVVAGQAAWADVCNSLLSAFDDDEVNPNGVEPSAYAIAPYFAGTSVDELNSSGIPEAKQWVEDNVGCAERAGVPLIAYEGGQDSFELGERGCQQIQGESGMRETYKEFLDAMLDAGLQGPFTQYTHSGNCWGLKRRTSDSTENSPKYQGVLEWLAEHP